MEMNLPRNHTRSITIARTSQSASQLTLQVPQSANLHIVFRRHLQQPPQPCSVDSHSELFAEKPFDLYGVSGAVRTHWGVSGFALTILKLCTRRRNLYVFVNEEDGSLSSFGWVNVGFCQHYPVTGREVVIGPIWTAEDCRGKGLATAGLTIALREMFLRGYRTFFIDTRERNVGAVKAITKAGFVPVAAHWRGLDADECQ